MAEKGAPPNPHGRQEACKADRLHVMESLKPVRRLCQGIRIRSPEQLPTHRAAVPIPSPSQLALLQLSSTYSNAGVGNAADDIFSDIDAQTLFALSLRYWQSLR